MQLASDINYHRRRVIVNSDNQLSSINVTADQGPGPGILRPWTIDGPTFLVYIRFLRLCSFLLEPGRSNRVETKRLT